MSSNCSQVYLRPHHILIINLLGFVNMFYYRKSIKCRNRILVNTYWSLIHTIILKKNYSFIHHDILITKFIYYYHKKWHTCVIAVEPQLLIVFLLLFFFFDSIKRKKDLILRSTVSQLNVYD
jgi:hypothetical protein